MDSHLAGAAARAARLLRKELPGLSLVVHAADEWGSDPVALAHCNADIAHGDIVIATMLFLEDHIRAVMPALDARRDRLRRDGVLPVGGRNRAADAARQIQT